MLDVHFACDQILWTGKVADLLLNGRSPRLATGFNGGARRHDQVSIVSTPMVSDLTSETTPTDPTGMLSGAASATVQLLIP